jgi:branched-chain amino acid transport system permease protein
MVEVLMIDSSTLILTIMWGAAIGCIYVLLATGLNLIFGVMKLVNFAHGELLMIGAYLGFTFVTALGANVYLAVLLSIPESFGYRKTQ